MITLKLPSALLLAAATLPLSVSPAQAAPLSQQEQLDQSRAQEAARQERLHQERTEVDTPALPSSSLPADENVRFPIAKVVLENESGKFYFLRHIARDYEGRELALKEINEAVGKMNHELMQRSFSTSRVVIPEQNLSEGKRSALFCRSAAFMPCALPRAVIRSIPTTSSRFARAMS